MWQKPVWGTESHAKLFTKVLFCASFPKLSPNSTLTTERPVEVVPVREVILLRDHNLDSERWILLFHSYQGPNGQELFHPKPIPKQSRSNWQIFLWNRFQKTLPSRNFIAYPKLESFCVACANRVGGCLIEKISRNGILAGRFSHSQ